MRKLTRLPRILSPRERFFLGFFVLLFILGAAAIVWNFWIRHTHEIPREGGKYVEGIVALGDPRLLNPLFAPLNDVDRDITGIVFSGLFTYTTAGELVPDLAESYEISDDGKTYTIHLRRDVRWHDDRLFSARDVVFTIHAAQDRDYQSPLRTNWQEGIAVEALDEFTVQFTLANAYAPFLENLTVGILPAHIWEQIPPQNAFLANFNQQPVGTGPYRFKKLLKDRASGSIREITLEANPNYYKGKPFISRLVFRFFQDEDAAIKAFRAKKIQGLSGVSPHMAAALAERGTLHRFAVPWYLAVFFNQTKSKPLADKNVRKALILGTDKKAIIDAVIAGEGIAVDSPILPWQLGYAPGGQEYSFDPEGARLLLEDAGWKDGDGDGIREKKVGGDADSTPLAITLTTRSLPSELGRTVQLLKEEWEKLGIRVDVDIADPGRLDEDIIRPREYQALLFGEALNAEPDLFAFWHSSQKKDPGFNLALYGRKEVDKLLEEARKMHDPDARAERYRKIQELITKDAPALFLYSPSFLYITDERLRGIEEGQLILPSYRFLTIRSWYLKTRRVWN